MGRKRARDRVPPGPRAFWSSESAGGRAGAAFAGRGWAGDGGDLGVFDDEAARGDQTGDLGITELAEEPEDIPIDRFFPEVLARSK